MNCPFCGAENRDEREDCYNCGKDLTMLRLIVNKSKQHYNLALEHAERNRIDEAIVELQNALDLNDDFVEAHVVLGTLYARNKQFDKADDQWRAALQRNPTLAKASDYLSKSQAQVHDSPTLRLYKGLTAGLAVLVLLLVAYDAYRSRAAAVPEGLEKAWSAYENNEWGHARELLDGIDRRKIGDKNVRLSYDLFTSSLRSQLESRQMLIAQSLRNHDFEGAVNAIADLRKRKPADVESLELRQTMVVEMAREDLEQLFAAYEQLGEGYPAIEAKLESVEKAEAAGLKELGAAEWRKKAEGLRTEVEGRRLASIKSEWLRSSNSEAALMELNGLTGGAPGSDEAKEFSTLLLSSVQKEIDKETRTRFLSDGSVQARDYVVNRLAVYPPKLREAVRRGLAEAPEFETAAGAGGAKQATNAAAANPAQEELAGKIFGRLFTPPDSETLDEAFLTAPGDKIPKDFARELLEVYPLLETRDNPSPYRVRQLRLYRAASHFALGERDVAKRLLDTYVTDYPQPTFDKYLTSAKAYLALLSVPN